MDKKTMLKIQSKRQGKVENEKWTMVSEVRIGENRQKEEAIQESIYVKAEKLELPTTQEFWPSSLWYLVCYMGLKGSFLRELYKVEEDSQIEK